MSYFKFDFNFDFYPSFYVYLYLSPLVSIFINLNSFAIIRLVFHKFSFLLLLTFFLFFFYFFVFSIEERNDVIHSKLELECAALRIEMKELNLKAKFSIDLGTFFFSLKFNKLNICK